MKDPFDEILTWCASVLGPFEITADASREHAGERAAAHRVQTSSGGYYVKIHRDRLHWENEVHAYEQWAFAFGELAPRLLAVRTEDPLALVISELPGKVMEELQLPVDQVLAVWRSAGKALAALHTLQAGNFFGPCRRDGACAGIAVSNACEYVKAEFESLLGRGMKMGCLSEEELAIVRSACAMVTAFEGESPVPCHRDYCPANWLVSQEGVWSGVIDFEFSAWDVRAADFVRHPNWDWIDQPALLEAFFDGYGRSFTPREEEQLLVAHTQYTLAAIVWGMENAYYGYAGDGRKALKHLGTLLT